MHYPEFIHSTVKDEFDYTLDIQYEPKHYAMFGLNIIGGRNERTCKYLQQTPHKQDRQNY